MAGGSDNLRAVVRFSAFVAYTRLGTLPADMRIDVRGIDFETVGLQVQARAAGGAKGVACVADPNLAQAALKLLEDPVGGTAV